MPRIARDGREDVGADGGALPEPGARAEEYQYAGGERDLPAVIGGRTHELRRRSPRHLGEARLETLFQLDLFREFGILQAVLFEGSRFRLTHLS